MLPGSKRSVVSGVFVVRAFLPILLLSALSAAASADDSSGKEKVFIAPSGEPYRVAGDQPYPVAAWFAAADKNGDGKLDPAEFQADFMQFFDAIDVNHDGAIDGTERERDGFVAGILLDAIDGVERIHYENEVAPETLGNSWSGPSQEETNAEWNSKFDDDVNLPDVDRPATKVGERRTGAGRFDLLGLPEPVAAMDMELRGRISRRAATEAATFRFNQLDAMHRGYLTLDALPKSPADRSGGDDRRKRR